MEIVHVFLRGPTSDSRHVCAAPGGSLPPRFIMAAADAYVPDIVAAADCVLGKIGYGGVRLLVPSTLLSLALCWRW